jgi:hypothetical protein
MNSNVRNILKVYDQATADEINEGLTWYARANAEARILHDRYVVGCSVVAAVSPGLRWERNIEAARRIIDGESLDGLGVRWYDGVRKAERIIAGEKPLSVLRGNKVRAFYRCIVNPKNKNAVCIDGHAYAIWAGRRIGTMDVPNITDKMYESISADYREAADLAGILPNQIQAITWIVWRRIHLDKGQLRLF